MAFASPAVSMTRSAGTKRKVGSLSMKRVMSQGHAMRSTRAFSRVTHFMDGSFPWRGALRVRAVGLAQGRLEPLGKLDGIVIRPEVHIEEPRCVHEAVVVEGRHIDAVLYQDPGDGVDLLVDQDEVSGDSRLAVGGRLEVHHRRHT